MEFDELKFRNEKELSDLLVQKREELRKLKFDLSQGKVKNVKLIKQTKKDIARILTAIKIQQSQVKK